MVRASARQPKRCAHAAALFMQAADAESPFACVLPDTGAAGIERGLKSFGDLLPAEGGVLLAIGQVA